MREIRPSGSVEGVMGNHDPYSDWVDSAPPRDISSSASTCGLLSVHWTGSGAPPSCTRVALHGMVEAAQGIKPARSWAQAPPLVVDLRIELSPFLFI